MQASHFGSTGRELFGIYHPPLGQRARDLGVLLCYPGPQEYMRVHWAFRKLAAALAREGFHVFRFDYSGTGDSWGDGNAGSFERWREDVATALEELRDVSGARKVSVVGFRLGAVLASQTAVKVRDLVLWEPVVDGAAHLAELCALHARRFANALHPPLLRRRGPVLELLGHPLPEAMEEAIRSLDLAPPFGCRAERVALVTAEAREEHDRLASRLGEGARQGSFAFERLQVQEDVVSGDEPFLLSTRAQQAIAALLGSRVA